MKVSARMNRIAWDRQRQRYVINWRLPKELHAVLSPEVCDRISRDGKWFRDRFPKSLTATQAAKLEAERLVEFNALVDGARRALASPERRAEVLTRLTDKGAGMMLAQGNRLVMLQAGMQRLYDDHDSVRRLASLGVVMQPSADTASQVYTFETCIRELWVWKRKRAGKSVSEKTIEKLVGSKVKRLVAYLRHDDMSRVSRDDLETSA